MIVQVLLPVGLAFIMFTLGLKLGWQDFARLLAEPKALLVGLALQLVMLPALAVLILLVWPLPPDLAIGLIVLSVSPGGITSNLLTGMARGDTALSISMTAISTVASLATIPLATSTALAFVAASSVPPDLNLWSMMRGVLVVATVPVALGMAVKQWAAPAAAAIERRARPLATMVFALIVLATFASQWSAMMQNLGALGPAVVALNVGIISLSAVVGRTLRLAAPQLVAIMIESSLRNAGLGILVSLTLLDNATAALPPTTYALVMNITVLCLVGAIRSGALVGWMDRGENATAGRGA